MPNDLPYSANWCRVVLLPSPQSHMPVTDRLQEAEALAAEGVQQTEALNRQLQQLKVRAAQDALSATAASEGMDGTEITPQEAQAEDKTDAAGQEITLSEQSKLEDSKESLEEQMKLALEVEERKRASEKELQLLEERVLMLQGELDQLREQRRLQLQQVQTDTLQVTQTS